MSNPLKKIIAFYLLLVFSTSLQATVLQTWADETLIARNSAEVGVGDFDQDGNVDIAIAGDEQRWYEGPDFTTYHKIGDSDGGPYAAQVADINGDGWLDFITSDGQRNAPDIPNGETGDLYVYLNPGAGADVTQTWQRITVYSGNVYHQNDLRIADMDGDGRMDIIERTWSSERVVVALQNANINNWTVRVFDTGESGKPEGISAGDIDGDGENEIVLSGVYWDNPGGWRTGNPIEHLIDAQFQGSTYGKVKSAVGDIDNDGDNDIYMASAEGSDRYLAWYENTGSNVSGGVNLTRHIIKNNFGKCHMVQLIDVDKDGDLDIATGRSFGEQGLYIFYNTTTASGVTWTEQNYDSTGEIYTGVVADLDGDFDLDVVGPTGFYRNSVRIYKNLTPTDPPVPLDLSPTSISFTDLGGSQNVTLDTDEGEDWSATSNQTWLTVNPTSGTGDDTLSLVAASNNTFLPRVASVEVSNSNNQKTVIINQAGMLDDIAPSDPVIQSISNVGSSSFNLSWQGSTDNSGVIKEYVIYLNSIEHSRATTTSTVVSGLTQLTNYSVQVSAVDPSDNESNLSNPSNVVTTETPPSPQPVFYWKLNELSGTQANEHINGVNYPLLAMPSDRWVTGLLGSALSFNDDGDDNDKIDLGTLDAPANALTLSAWINPVDLTNNGEGRILAKATGISSGDHYWMLSTIKSGTEFVPRVRLRTGGSVTTLLGSNTNPISENAWQHIAATYDGSNLRLYLDGAEVASVAKTGLVDQSNSVNASIGNIPAGDSSTRAFDGLIDEVCIFDIALTAQNIDDIYNSGDGAPCDNFGDGATDTTAPVIQEVTAIISPDTDLTPSFTLNTNEAGTAEFLGDCAATPDQLINAGNTQITLVELSYDTFSNCRVQVRDAADNVSNQITLTTFEIVEPDTTPPTVTVEQANDQADPTESNIAKFIISFSELINISTLSASDISLSGTSTGVVTVGPSVVSGSGGLQFEFIVTMMTLDDVVQAELPAGRVSDLAGNLNLASTSLDNSVSYICDDCGLIDDDGDGVGNDLDNCPEDFNPDQMDIDGNGIGDVCDDDSFCFPILSNNNRLSLICL